VDTAREALGPEAVLFTTDPPQVAPIGSLDGEEVLTCAPAPRLRAYPNPIPTGLCIRARAPRYALDPCLMAAMVRACERRPRRCVTRRPRLWGPWRALGRGQPPCP